MAAKKTELALIENPSSFLPSAQELNDVMEDLRDILSRSTFGTVTIAGGGAGVFKVKEPGAEQPDSVQEIECVILASHPTNVRWGHEYGARQLGERPVCRSADGETGIEEETGETHNCATCPYNQYPKPGVRKECTNKQQLYIMRRGDVLPLLFALPPTALNTFKNYRVLLAASIKEKMYALVTRISLRMDKNDNNNEYCVPVFTPVGKLNLDEAKAAKEIVRGMMEAAQRNGIIVDDAIEESPAPAQAAAANAFVQVDDEDLPFPEQGGF